MQIQCKYCQGNGEVVTDWARYLNPKSSDAGDEATAECPHCNGQGQIDDPYMSAVRELNEAAYAAIRSCKDTTLYPMVNRHMLREIAAMTDRLVDAGPDETAG